MVASQNGWRANDPSVVSRRTVPGTQVGITVHNGPSGDLLLEVASRFDRDVQDIDNARGALDDWGYAERPIRGDTALSNHASGTAIDLNALKWPLGSSPAVNLNPIQIQRVRQIVNATAGVVRWGGDYVGRKDPMHFEINDGQSEADCARALAALRNTDIPIPTPATPTWTDGTYCQYNDRSDRVLNLQRFMTKVFSGYNPYTPTGFYGDATKAGVKEFQARVGITGPDADGTIVGPKTMNALIQRGFRP